ncbi:MAG: hypothetical protein EPO06_03735 [Burkholderiaceae bacterium]|nr:MAG: hypothetical protein EPO06_03735 [Burkholderiaceae bacterium]
MTAYTASLFISVNPKISGEFSKEDSQREEYRRRDKNADTAIKQATFVHPHKLERGILIAQEEPQCNDE